METIVSGNWNQFKNAQSKNVVSISLPAPPGRPLKQDKEPQIILNRLEVEVRGPYWIIKSNKSQEKRWFYRDKLAICFLLIQVY